MNLHQLADIPAETAVSAIAAHTRDGARLAHEHGVRVAHFTVPPLGRVYGAAVELADVVSHEDRLAAIAHRAQVDPGWLGDLVHAPRRCLRDTSGSYARRVIASAERVAQYEHHIAALADLGVQVAA